MQNTEMSLRVRSMNAAQIIHEIDSMDERERRDVIAYLRRQEEDRFHQEQVKIAAQRLKDLDDGLEEEVSYEETMTLLRNRL
ncbi:MAG: hypothetical protein ACLFS4_03315 [Opitutales bacterium]